MKFLIWRFAGSFIINQLFIYQLIFTRFNMRGYVFVYSIHHISFLKKEVERKRWILYFLINVRKCEKKTCWKRTNLSKHHRLNLAKCFFSPSFIRNKFFEYFNSMRKQQKSKNFGFLFGTNDIYNENSVQINRISDQMKDRI